MTLTQSRAPGRVIGWTSFSHWHSVNGLHGNFQYFMVAVLECCNLFPGVNVSVRSFSFI